MKKAILLMSMILSITTLMDSVFAAEHTDQEHFAYEYCIELDSEDIVKPDTCRRLNSDISKGEFVKILLHVARIDTDTSLQMNIRDLTDDFVRSEVYTAFQEGILLGENGDSTRSGAMKTLNRATAVTIGARAYPIIDEFPSSGSLYDLDNNVWYSEYAKKSVSAAVIVGKQRGGRRLFAAADLLTYGEAMALAYQFERAERAYDEWKAKIGTGVPSRDEILKVDPLQEQSSVSLVPNMTGVVRGRDDKEKENELKIENIPFDQFNIPAGANNVLFGKFKVSGNEETIEEITITRGGPGSERDFDQVYLFFSDSLDEQELAIRVTNGKSIDSSTQQVTFSVNLMIEGSAYLELRASLNQNASPSSQHRFRIRSVKTDKKLYEYGLNDASKTTEYSTFSRAEPGVVVMRNNGSLGGIFPGTRRRITRWEFQNNAGEDLFFKSITLSVSGVNASAMENFSLFKTNGEQFLGYTESHNMMGSTFTLQVCENPDASVCEPLLIERGDTVVFHVDADLTGINQYNSITVSVDEPIDVDLVGVTTGTGIPVNVSEYETTVE